MVHTSVGNTLWGQCWQDRKDHITGTHMVPYKLLNILKWVSEQPQLQLASADLVGGELRYKAVQAAATCRRQRGVPY